LEVLESASSIPDIVVAKVFMVERLRVWTFLPDVVFLK